MKVVWKDTEKTKQDYKYRDHIISRYKGGWIIDIKGNKNIYYSLDCAYNAIDEILGGKTRKDASARQKKGIKIIGSIGMD